MALQRLDISDDQPEQLDPYDHVNLIFTKSSNAPNQYKSIDTETTRALRSMAKRGIITILNDRDGIVWARGPHHRTLSKNAG